MLALNVAPVNGHAARFGAGSGVLGMMTSGALARIRAGQGQGVMILQGSGSGRIRTSSDLSRKVNGSGWCGLVLYAANRMTRSNPVPARFVRNVLERRLQVPVDRSRFIIAAQHRRFIVA